MVAHGVRETDLPHGKEATAPEVVAMGGTFKTCERSEDGQASDEGRTGTGRMGGTDGTVVVTVTSIGLSTIKDEVRRDD